MFELVRYTQIAIHGGGDDLGGIVGVLSVVLDAIGHLLTLSPAGVFAALLPGVSALTNWHPLAVHFPIAFLMGFVLIDWAGSLFAKPAWRETAGWLLYLGTLFAGLTVALGLLAAGAVAHGDDVHEIMEQHEHLGISVLLLAITLSAWRLFAINSIQGVLSPFYGVLSGLLGLLVIFTADLGGLMVYQHGVAVQSLTAASSEAVENHHHDHDDHDDHHH